MWKRDQLFFKRAISFTKPTPRHGPTMAFGLGSLIEASILFVNALAILSEPRFLKQISGVGSGGEAAFGGEPTIKDKIISMLQAVRMVLLSTAPALCRPPPTSKKCGIGCVCACVCVLRKCRATECPLRGGSEVVIR